MSLVLGITGSIATGKSTVVDIFRAAGFPIVDGDVIAREIVAKGQPALTEIANQFGPEYLTITGELNRQKLGQLIFSDDEARLKLDKLMDSYLRANFREKILHAKEQSPLVIVDIPLLFEQHYETIVDQVAVVYVPETIQLTRLMQRNNLSEKEAKERMASQMSVETKKQLADVVFNNQGSLADIKEIVQQWIDLNVKQ